MALYENCVRFRSLPQTKDFEYSLLRRLLGVEEGKYKAFKDFNKRVLSPAVEEVNTISDIFVSPKITRRARAVQSIMFKLEERPMKKRIGQLSKTDVVNREQNRSDLTEQLLTQLVSEYGKERVQTAVDYITSTKSYKAGAITNLESYIRAAIEKNYSNKPVDMRKVMQRLNQVDADNREATKALNQKYDSYLRSEKIRIMQAVPDKKLDFLVTQFESSEELSSSVLSNVFSSRSEEHV